MFKWSTARKSMQLFVITLAAIVPDFDSGIGVAAIYGLARQYDSTTGEINNLTSNAACDYEAGASFYLHGDAYSP
ncbi:hypothetical protein EVJ58_g7683 [Rhodofomes roseus]|uniref:Uncharacterized protein n=1 Tax=Rhodofomes roseus TaxID=34475 RepID=A0A4Y9Y470_9APHY|nr:hypothetical protein EVJ58_g7683 [Rhodofomes roseus]